MKRYLDIYKELTAKSGKITIKQIFTESWSSFVDEMDKKDKPIRPVIIEEVEKIIGCQDPSNGFALYICPKCNTIMNVPFHL